MSFQASLRVLRSDIYFSPFHAFAHLIAASHVLPFLWFSPLHGNTGVWLTISILGKRLGVFFLPH